MLSEFEFPSCVIQQPSPIAPETFHWMVRQLDEEEVGSLLVAKFPRHGCGKECNFANRKKQKSSLQTDVFIVDP